MQYDELMVFSMLFTECSQDLTSQRENFRSKSTAFCIFIEYHRKSKYSNSEQKESHKVRSHGNSYEKTTQQLTIYMQSLRKKYFHRQHGTNKA